MLRNEGFNFLHPAFLQSRVSEPLLCLTALITLRDTILPDAPQRSQFAEKLAQAGIKVLAPELKQSDESDEGDAMMQGMSESNLLESLNGGTNLQTRRFYDPNLITLYIKALLSTPKLPPYL